MHSNLRLLTHDRFFTHIPFTTIPGLEVMGHLHQEFSSPPWRLKKKGGFPFEGHPEGKFMGKGTNPTSNPDRVVLRILDKSVTFMGVMSHAGNEYQGFHARKFVVSGFYYYVVAATRGCGM